MADTIIPTFVPAVRGYLLPRRRPSQSNTLRIDVIVSSSLTERSIDKDMHAEGVRVLQLLLELAGRLTAYVTCEDCEAELDAFERQHRCEDCRCEFFCDCPLPCKACAEASQRASDAEGDL